MFTEDFIFISTTLISLIVVTILWGMSVYLFAVAILGYKVKGKSILLFSLFSIIPQLISNAVLVYMVYSDTLETHFNINIWDAVFLHASFFLLSFMLSRSYQDNLLKIITTAALAQFVCHSIYYMFNEIFILLFLEPLEDSLVGLIILVQLMPYLFLLLTAYLLSIFLKKIRFSHYYSSLFNNKATAIVSFVFCWLLMNSYLLSRLLLKKWENVFGIQGLSFLFIVIVLIFVQTIAVIATGRERLKVQEETITQQKAYVALLEDFHTELKTFRHDFQNVLAGMALQADEGNIEQLKSFLGNTVGYFDNKIGQEIKRMGQLSAIEIYSLRSLLTVKISEIKTKNIGVTVSVPQPVNKVGIKEEDFIRCVGVLLDNAIEECTAYSNSQIDIIFLQEENEMRLAISNTCPKQPNLQTMAKTGFSTKGNNRGLGLASYQRIISNYPNCVTRTIWTDGILTQELRISTSKNQF